MDSERLPHLARHLTLALRQSHDGGLQTLRNIEPENERDELLALSFVHDLHLAPLTSVGSQARWQHHPAVAGLKQRAEATFVSSLNDSTGTAVSSTVAHETIRAIAARDRTPPIYEWVAHDASRRELVDFLALEGGPDDGFDDLVACCQIGLTGSPKMEMAQNYWDEMGAGDPSQVHRSLHRELRTALELPTISRADLPVVALRRMLLTSTLATNRSFQPELIGVLGMIELQAGPRCRQVVRGLERLDLPVAATPFYAVHATTDPRHGKDWLDKVIAPLSRDAHTAGGIVRGARWRSAVDNAFFTSLGKQFGHEREPQAA